MAQEIQVEGDDMFIGFASRLDAGNLKPGMLQASFNTRLQRGIAQPRKGTKRLTSSVVITLTMVGSGLYVDANGKDNIVMVFMDRIYLYRPAQGSQPSQLSQAFSFPPNRTIEEGDICDVVTALDKVYIFRGKYDKTTFEATASNDSIPTGSSGLITITTASPHGYSNGDEVTIGRTDGNDGPGQTVTNSYIITVTSPTAFTFEYENNTGATYAARPTQTGWTA